MNSFHDLYNQQSTQPNHPKIPEWTDIINEARYTNKAVEFFREKDGLTYAPAYLYLKYKANGKNKSSDSKYHPELDRFLYDNNIKAINIANESERGGYWLKLKLEEGDITYGDGFFNAVLVNVIKDFFQGNPEIDAILKKIVRLNPRSSNEYGECRKFIVSSLYEYVNKLKALGYNEPQSLDVSSKAIVYYMDERFHISNSELLFGNNELEQ